MLSFVSGLSSLFESSSEEKLFDLFNMKLSISSGFRLSSLFGEWKGKLVLNKLFFLPLLFSSFFSFTNNDNPDTFIDDFFTSFSL